MSFCFFLALSFWQFITGLLSIQSLSGFISSGSNHSQQESWSDLPMLPLPEVEVPDAPVTVFGAPGQGGTSLLNVQVRAFRSSASETSKLGCSPFSWGSYHLHDESFGNS